MIDSIVTPLKKHRIHKKLVLAPFHDLSIEEVDWSKNLLAEHIWMDLLQQAYPKEYYHYFSSLLDAIDSLTLGPNIVSGLISDFAFVPVDKRATLLQDNQDIITKCFAPSIGKPLSLFPDCPVGWLIPEGSKVKDEDSKQEALESLAGSVIRLWPAKDDYVGNIRQLPFARFIKNGKVSFPKNPKFTRIIDMLVKYPGGLTLDERLECQQFCRVSMGCILGAREISNEWSKYFWSHNLSLTECIYPDIESSKTEDGDENLVDVCKHNLKVSNEFFNGIFSVYRPDSYNPVKDEINLGLLARIHSLYLEIIRNCARGNAEVARILLRCFADTAIVYCYLIKKDSEELYNAFYKYSRGREKLLLLHIQDNYPDFPTPSGENVINLLESLGGPFSLSMIDIDLANWVDTPPRAMAEEVGLKSIYNMVYEPTSSDVHGLWSNLRNYHLTYCLNPLHRLHRLPFGCEATMNKLPIDCSTSVLASVMKKSNEKFGWPSTTEGFKIVGKCNPSWMQTYWG